MPPVVPSPLRPHIGHLFPPYACTSGGVPCAACGAPVPGDPYWLSVRSICLHQWECPLCRLRCPRPWGPSLATCSLHMPAPVGVSLVPPAVPLPLGAHIGPLFAPYACSSADVLCADCSAPAPGATYWPLVRSICLHQYGCPLCRLRCPPPLGPHIGHLFALYACTSGGVPCAACGALAPEAPYWISVPSICLHQWGGLSIPGLSPEVEGWFSATSSSGLLQKL